MKTTKFKPQRSEKVRREGLKRSITIHLGDDGPGIYDALNRWCEDTHTSKNSLLKQLIVHGLHEAGYRIKKANNK